MLETWRKTYMLQALVEKISKRSNFASHLGKTRRPRFDWSAGWASGFAAGEKSRHPKSGWTNRPGPTPAGLLAESHVPRSGCTHHPGSSSVAGRVDSPRSSGWLKRAPKVKLTRRIGSVTNSKLWLKWAPKVKLWRLSGNKIPSRFWLNLSPNFKIWRRFGKSTCWTLSLKRFPKLKLCNSSGKVSATSPKLSPNSSSCKFLGKFILSKWFMPSAKDKLLRLLGKANVSNSVSWSDHPLKFKLWSSSKLSLRLPMAPKNTNAENKHK